MNIKKPLMQYGQYSEYRANQIHYSVFNWYVSTTDRIIIFCLLEADVKQGSVYNDKKLAYAGG